MKKVTDLGKNECIHCDTLDKFESIVKLNPNSRLKKELWDIQKKDSVYYPKSDTSGRVSFSQACNHTIHKADDFLQESFEYLEEVEVSDNCVNWYVKIFGCLYPKESRSTYKIVVFDKDGILDHYSFVRKINTEKVKAIETIKDLMTKHEIKKEEL